MENKEFKSYQLAKYYIQMTNVVLVDVKAMKLTNGELDSKVRFKSALSYKVEILDDRKSHGYLRVHVKLCDQEDMDMYEFETTHRGVFESENEISREDLYEFTEIQVVPQLLSYARTTIGSLASQMLLPPVLLPTMDILQSIHDSKDRNNDLLTEE
ncbi:protein-export chaperone SecB [Tumebacillus flagellatus]|uniref:Preprotein translocase subunit SecB n=1 Tax=Tumebacillus flagellatus TaxID=1157490 RepID=A0A074LGX0_9BACL|nr:protein-export chaperone SecB [Tumebacillus flagellatus]KEO81476.1 hypothetical protein EL26_20585 [Tumebacillus flagellatus]